MSSQWLHGELRRVIGRARSLSEADEKAVLYLLFRRGELRVSVDRDLPGWARATPMALPIGKDDEGLFDWMLHECKSVPCHR